MGHEVRGNPARPRRMSASETCKSNRKTRKPAALCQGFLLCSCMAAQGFITAPAPTSNSWEQSPSSGRIQRPSRSPHTRSLSSSPHPALSPTPRTSAPVADPPPDFDTLLPRTGSPVRPSSPGARWSCVSSTRPGNRSPSLSASASKPMLSNSRIRSGVGILRCRFQRGDAASEDAHSSVWLKS